MGSFVSRAQGAQEAVLAQVAGDTRATSMPRGATCLGPGSNSATISLCDLGQVTLLSGPLFPHAYHLETSGPIQRWLPSKGGNLMLSASGDKRDKFLRLKEEF